MSTEFRNAYHFIPRTPPATPWPGFPKASGFGKAGNHPEWGHAVYAQGTLSGRIRCGITLEQPTVIGAVRHKGDKNQYAVVTPFMFQGRPAIPATSLKGMISAVVEAASQSTYRVMNNEQPLTVSWYNPKSQDDPTVKKSERKKFSETAVEFTPPDLRPGAGFSVADRLFGYVRDGAAKDQTLQALAGRLRFSHALPAGKFANAPLNDFWDSEIQKIPQSVCAGDTPVESESGYVRIKELAQPMKEWTEEDKKTKTSVGPTYRSATPRMYFKRLNGDQNKFISKSDFSDGGPERFVIQGQKAYLHQAISVSPDKQPWQTRRSIDQDLATTDEKGDYKEPAASRKSIVRPVLAKTEFEFDIRFDNLSNDELNLLCFALHPSRAFRHKIGYGKSLGLGSVKLSPLGLDFVDRKARY